MTLIFAGHNLLFNENETKSNGLFVTADSAITTINSANTECTPILNGFKKIYPLNIKVYKPSFSYSYDGGYFSGYHDIHFEHTGFLAIAGSTLVLQHIMNEINSHMQNLRIVKNNTTYEIIRECEPNNLIKNEGKVFYPQEIYTDDDYIGLNKSKTYFKHIEYSIKNSLNSAKPKKVVGKLDINRMKFEIVIGLYCDVSHEYMLKTYSCEPTMITAGEWNFFLSTKNISKDEIAVLGLKNDENRAMSLLSTFIREKATISDKYFELLNTCIDENNLESNQTLRFAISKPSVLYELEQNQLSKVKFHNGKRVITLRNRIVNDI